MSRTNGYVKGTIIEEVGGAKVVAQALGISSAAVYQWRGRVPEKRISDFCRAFGRKTNEIRSANHQLASPSPKYRLIPAHELEAISTLANLYLLQQQKHPAAPYIQTTHQTPKMDK